VSSPRKEPISGARVLCVSRGHLLLVRHEDPSTGAAYWVLPGGGRERGERLAETAVREVREETGIAVRILRRLRVPTDVPHVSYALFLAEPVAHVAPAPTVDLGGEAYLRGAAWHPVTPADPLGPLDPLFWGYLGRRIRRMLHTGAGPAGRGDRDAEPGPP
jgi:ADP-ribose pyrophosphatase YjhB (NUDIX family)